MCTLSHIKLKKWGFNAFGTAFTEKLWSSNSLSLFVKLNFLSTEPAVFERVDVRDVFETENHFSPEQKDESLQRSFL